MGLNLIAVEATIIYKKCKPIFDWTLDKFTIIWLTWRESRILARARYKLVFATFNILQQKCWRIIRGFGWFCCYSNPRINPQDSPTNISFRPKSIQAKASVSFNRNFLITGGGRFVQSPNLKDAHFFLILTGYYPISDMSREHQPWRHLRCILSYWNIRGDKISIHCNSLILLWGGIFINLASPSATHW